MSSPTSVGDEALELELELEAVAPELVVAAAAAASVVAAASTGPGAADGVVCADAVETPAVNAAHEARINALLEHARRPLRESREKV